MMQHKGGGNIDLSTINNSYDNLDTEDQMFLKFNLDSPQNVIPMETNQLEEKLNSLDSDLVFFL